MDLPNSTNFNRFVPKEKFYSKTSINSKIRQSFTNEIERITWINKISPKTLNITSGEYGELQVFEISLKTEDISNALLKHIDTFIPYPILFILKKPGAVKAAISFKEPNMKNENLMKVDSYYDTGWKQSLQLELKGRSVDEIYKNYLYQIAPGLKAVGQANTKAAIEISKEHQAITKKIEGLRRMMANEPSIAKRQELARERYQLEQYLENLQGNT
ncbi:hypothetical protein A2707_04060 [Candidatus Saccharibacteria bacterium RIFCSPHIGHO2_01_FULL_45_15]|nr:MAG: hypothetical protein A2707_04060 [Candidatus Saccharibacteria bacterium RIFCSPHIGHO2_01_FULL_45_15]OGL27119.1 MAG: hypothetical protein A3C39_00960 [Candidatus Saccharibacteria bacterium RIFCSPHIGHO2_02_FULL_46_12]OGL31552.1 MAG: hypothetical protein A3E76_02360 [Candidatus Saccharibacteria bacterium RIFCSPHIGHO2_12_FULL_44_22]